MKSKRWKEPYTTKEIEYMLANHGVLTNQEIADKLGRTKEAIASRVYQLKKKQAFQR